MDYVLTGFSLGLMALTRSILLSGAGNEGLLRNFGSNWKAIDRIILYLIIPLLVTVFVFKEKPSDYGFHLGDWRAGVILAMGGVVLMTPIIWLLGKSNASMHGYYSYQMGMYMPLATFLDLFGWGNTYFVDGS